VNYEREIGHLFDEPIALLELGVQRGGSMLLWRDLFPHAEIAGLDLNLIDIPDDSGRISVYQGFQQDTALLDRIAAEVAPDGFDLIIDDASHVGQYTAASFWHLFPRHLKPGGTYILDDWSAAYWSTWTDGRDYSGSREALGDIPASAQQAPGRAETARRRIRSSARPLAARISDRSPELRRKLEQLYVKLEGRWIQRRFRSHDYGMVGFVKQLVDACAIDAIDHRQHDPRGLIESVKITPSQVFVRRADR
jgi:SAM-dependent methyltransferase